MSKKWEKKTPKEFEEMHARLGVGGVYETNTNPRGVFTGGKTRKALANVLGPTEMLRIAGLSTTARRAVGEDLATLDENDILSPEKTVTAWRNRFPTSRNLKVRNRVLSDTDFAAMAGVPNIDITGCNCTSVTAAGWRHLRGIHTLNMSHCTGITDAAFVHLAGIHTLEMDGCSAGITDAAFVHLRGIHTLHMNHCTVITDAAFVHLAGIHTLEMDGCDQATITDAAFVHLRGIHTLQMAFCRQITDAAFVHLAGIHTLGMNFCSGLTDAAFAHLRGIHTLNMRHCYQPTITDAAFEHLRGIHTLNMSDCNQITDAAFAHLAGIHTLVMDGCTGITDAAFVHLGDIHTLYINSCTQITDAAFAPLRGIQVLEMSYCIGITGERLSDLGCNLEVLNVRGCIASCLEAARIQYGVTESNSKVQHLPASCGGGARSPRGGRRKTRKQKRIMPRSTLSKRSSRKRISKMKCQSTSNSNSKLPAFKAYSCIGMKKMGKDGFYTPHENNNGMWVWKKI